MKAYETNLLKVLDGTKQFLIPTYQRTYSWNIKHCEQLWEDIIRIGSNHKYTNHFIGGILYISEEEVNLGGVIHASIIDGQQRITTCSLLLCALAEISKEHNNETIAKDIEGYLINSGKNGEDKYKLLLTDLDRKKYITILEGRRIDEDDTSNIIINYIFFKNKLSENIDKLDIIQKGIAKLFVVDISLNRNQDNPQLIFESMNSTGLALSKAELIKNYLFMGIDPQQQSILYEQYRFFMDQILENNKNLYDMFFRDYLTFKSESGVIPTLRSLYEEFKSFLKIENKEIKEILIDISKVFNYYARFTLLITEKDDEIKQVLMDIETLQVNVAYPLMFELFWDYEEQLLNKEHLISILRLIESYVFRRSICGIPTNSLNKTFATFKKYLVKENSDTYYESFIAHLTRLDSYKVFPNNELFKSSLILKDVYNFRNGKYLLEKIENHNKKEKIFADNYSIEHIMPKNTKNNDIWKKEIGDNRKEVYDKYLHTIGNLTLTGYNTEYSDRPFQEKKTMDGKGFNYSPIGLNGMIKELESWNEISILNRAKQLAELAAEVWQYDELDEKALGKYEIEESNNNRHDRTYDDHKYLKGKSMLLFNKLKDRILGLHPEVREEVKGLYIAFKYNTNFVDIEPQKNKLRLTLNMDYEDIRDTQGICKDVTGLGAWGNGNVSLHVSEESDYEYILFLIKQSLNKQFE